MFVTTSRLGDATASVQIVDQHAARCAYLEFALNPGFEKGLLGFILHRAVAAVPVASLEEWPLALARKLDSDLRSDMEDPASKNPTSALFAAFSATREFVSVCTAGDLRVHYAVDDKIVHVTRDHVHAHDPFDNPSLPQTHLELPATLSTRWLGGSPTRPPEVQTWPAKSPYTIFVCSSQYHRWKEHSDYGVRQLRKDLRSSSLDSGLIVAVEAPR